MLGHGPVLHYSALQNDLKPEQAENISERLETGEKAANAPILYPIENARHDYTLGNGGLRVAAAMADKPVQRASLKEKLAAYKAQVSWSRQGRYGKREKEGGNTVTIKKIKIQPLSGLAIKKFRLI